MPATTLLTPCNIFASHSTPSLHKTLHLLEKEHPCGLIFRIQSNYFVPIFVSPCNTSSARTEIGVIKRGIAGIKIEHVKIGEKRRNVEKMSDRHVYTHFSFTEILTLDDDEVGKSFEIFRHVLLSVQPFSKFIEL